TFMYATFARAFSTFSSNSRPGMRPVTLKSRAKLRRPEHARHGDDPCVMQRFTPNDAVFILPKYSHLYPGNSAIVVSATPDPFRAMFNEYVLEFPDGSNAKLFEFQIIEDIPLYKTFVASVLFDSRKQTAVTGVRGVPSPGGQ